MLKLTFLFFLSCAGGSNRRDLRNILWGMSRKKLRIPFSFTIFFSSTFTSDDKHDVWGCGVLQIISLLVNIIVKSDEDKDGEDEREDEE